MAAVANVGMRSRRHREVTGFYPAHDWFDTTACVFHQPGAVAGSNEGEFFRSGGGYLIDVVVDVLGGDASVVSVLGID